MEKFLFHTFDPQMIFIFHLYCIKYRVFRKKTVKSTKVPNPMAFFTETTAVNTHALYLTYFDIWGCAFWEWAKMWEVAWFWFIQNSWLKPKYMLFMFLQICYLTPGWYSEGKINVMYFPENERILTKYGELISMIPLILNTDRGL